MAILAIVKSFPVIPDSTETAADITVSVKLVSDTPELTERCNHPCLSQVYSNHSWDDEYAVALLSSVKPVLVTSELAKSTAAIHVSQFTSRHSWVDLDCRGHPNGIQVLCRPGPLLPPLCPRGLQLTMWYMINIWSCTSTYWKRNFWKYENNFPEPIWFVYGSYARDCSSLSCHAYRSCSASRVYCDCSRLSYNVHISCFYLACYVKSTEMVLAVMSHHVHWDYSCLSSHAFKFPYYG